MNLRQRFLAQQLGKLAAGEELQKFDGSGTISPGFLASMRSTFTQPFAKIPYNPQFGNTPEYLDTQINRALDRDGQSPSDVQAQINTSTSKVVGTTTTAAPGAEPVGFGGGGNSGGIGRQLGHAGAAGTTTLAAPPTADPVVGRQAPGGSLMPQSSQGLPTSGPPGSSVGTAPLQPAPTQPPVT